MSSQETTQQQELPYEQPFMASTLDAIVAESQPKSAETTLVNSYDVVSDHLEFVEENADTDLVNMEFALIQLLDECKFEKTDAVKEFLESKLKETQEKAQNLFKEVRVENAKRFAERILHKYRKWNQTRFGDTPATQKCFYTGEDRINFDINPVIIEQIVVDQLATLCLPLGLDANLIVKTLNIGKNSAVRFRQFMDVDLTPELISESDSYGSDF